MNGIGQPRILAVGEELPPLNAADRPTPKPTRAGKAKGSAQTVRKGKGERFRLLNGFVDFSLADLTRGEIAVWLILYRDSRDGIAQTSIADLARRGGLNRVTVIRALRRLEGAGLLQAVHRGGLNRGPSRYRVLPLVRTT
jgi:hypothetical protein